MQAVDRLSSPTFAICCRLAAVGAARSARVAALPRVQRVRYKRSGAPAPSVDVVVDVSSPPWHQWLRAVVPPVGVAGPGVMVPSAIGPAHLCIIVGGMDFWADMAAH